MRLRQTEAEATTSVHPTPAQGDIREEYVRSSSTQSVAQQGDRTTADESSRFSIRETLWVTFCMVGMAALSYMISIHLTYATAGMRMPFPVPSGTIPWMISFVSLALNIAAIGIGAGLLANRRTMMVSITIANIVGLLITVGYFCVILAPYVLSASAAYVFPAFFFPALFSTVIATLGEVAIALYMSRKFRKEP